LLGLTITDQFEGQSSDRYAEAEKIFQSLTDPYERWYYTGLLQERRAKAQIRAGRPAHVLVGSFQEAMRCFEEAEKIRRPTMMTRCSVEPMCSIAGENRACRG